jgi:hypothetical protein
VKIRFQADADLNHVILLAVVRRRPAIDFHSAVAARLAGLDDLAVLALAATEGRVLVSHDQTTMPSHFGRFIGAQSSPGLIVVPQHIPSAAVADDLILIWEATDAEEWTNRIFFLPI